MKTDLKKAAIKGIKWNGISTASTILIQLLQTAVLARLLDHEDFGIVAVAGLATTFSTLFLDIGMNALIVQRNDISRHEMHSLFWTNIMMGALSYLVLFLLAPVLEATFGMQGLSTLIRLLSLSLVILPFEFQFSAILQKRLVFRTLEWRNIISGFVSFISGSWAALNGLGVYALVIQQLAGTVSGVAYVINAGSKFYMPAFTWSPSHLRRFLRFGIYVTLDGFLNFFNRQLDSILIGKIAGPQPLGIYTQSKNLAIRPYGIINPAFTKVAFPILARSKDQPVMLREIYLKTILSLCTLNFPVYLFISVFSEDIIAILLGAKWSECAPILRILALAYMIRSVFNPMGALLLSLGKPGISFRWNTTMFVSTILAYMLTIRNNVSFIALGQLSLMLLLLFPSWRYLLYPIAGITSKQFFMKLASPLAAGTTALIPPMLYCYIFEDQNTMLRLGITLFLFLFSYIGATSVFNKEMFRLIKEQLREQKTDLQLFLRKEK